MLPRKWTTLLLAFSKHSLLFLKHFYSSINLVIQHILTEHLLWTKHLESESTRFESSYYLNVGKSFHLPEPSVKWRQQELPSRVDARIKWGNKDNHWAQYLPNRMGLILSLTLFYVMHLIFKALIVGHI